MNGAITELFATISSNPTSSRTTRIGASQYFRFSRMNCQTSPRTCIFDMGLLRSEHFLVVARIALPTGVGVPVGAGRPGPAPERIAAGPSPHEPEGRDDSEIHERQDHRRHD